MKSNNKRNTEAFRIWMHAPDVDQSHLNELKDDYQPIQDMISRAKHQRDMQNMAERIAEESQAHANTSLETWNIDEYLHDSIFESFMNQTRRDEIKPVKDYDIALRQIARLQDACEDMHGIRAKESEGRLEHTTRNRAKEKKHVNVNEGVDRKFKHQSRFRFGCTKEIQNIDGSLNSNMPQEESSRGPRSKSLIGDPVEMFTKLPYKDRLNEYIYAPQISVIPKGAK